MTHYTALRSARSRQMMIRLIIAVDSVRAGLAYKEVRGFSIRQLSCYDTMIAFTCAICVLLIDALLKSAANQSLSPP